MSSFFLEYSEKNEGAADLALIMGLSVPPTDSNKINSSNDSNTEVNIYFITSSLI